MTSKRHSGSSKPNPDDRDLLPEILGYLNFSGGKPDPKFQRNFNRWHAAFGLDRPCGELRDALLEPLDALPEESSAFAETDQAEAVIRLVFDECLPAYRNFHADLLFHLSDEQFRQPLFLVRMFEAVLAQGEPWEDRDRIIQGTLEHLNDFVGFRPLAVLENNRQMEPYPHERFRPVPLYIDGAGVAAGPYEPLIEQTLKLFRETPEDILQEAHFDLSLLDELALDVRAHDHLHPVNKRTNYMFGEWDPHHIDSQGRYRRFVVRQIILEFLLQWIRETPGTNIEELRYDASAVLCGTMLMASAISGSGPETHDSSVTLTSLLPKVARQRDAFYSRLLEQATGVRAKRLHREAKQTQQPFGHIRQHLNIELAQYGAQQVQHRALGQLYAQMGYPEASREEALTIPSASARFECEIHWRMTTAHRDLNRGAVAEARQQIREVEDYLHRGIECGALIDPWNILGFGGQFPLFSSREDSVPDHRAEVLLQLMEESFGLYSRAVGEAAVQGDGPLREELSAGFKALADEWDRYATHVVADLPTVVGRESWESANRVAQTLSEWRAAGEAAGDISFWRQHVEQFDSAKAYAQVVETLLDKRDHVAAMGLLMQWLSQADEVGLESGPHSIYGLLLRWMHLVTGFGRDGEAPGGPPAAVKSGEGSSLPQEDAWPTLRRLFDYLEANAGDYWSLAGLDEATGISEISVERGSPEEWGETLDEELLEEEPDEDEGLFEAAYDNVVYRDSAEDGSLHDTLEPGEASMNTEIDVIARHLEPRLKFLNTLAQLWQIAGATLACRPHGNSPAEFDQEQIEVVLGWQYRCRELQRELIGLMNSVWEYEIPLPSGDHDSNIEYDLQLQTKFYLLHTIIAASISCRSAERSLLCCVPDSALPEELATDETPILDVYRSIFRRDGADVRRRLPKLLDQLGRRSLLYTPLDGGGPPEPIRAARNLQAVIRFLLSELPRMGLFRETWHVLRTAYRMERNSRPGGMAVTEFDRLFRTALRNTLEGVIRSSARWRSGKFSDEDLVEVVSEIVERYLDVWLKHSGTMRLSSVEALKQEEIWEDVTEFIARYGRDLFHAHMLTLGNLRAILHNGINRFLQTLADNRDPLHPLALLDDLEEGVVSEDYVEDCLEVVYGSIVDKFDRFLEYNTMTTQSDYGELFYCLLDFLRVEADYDRNGWNLAPIGIAHEVLSECGRDEAAMIWETIFEARTEDMADEHLDELNELEQTYGMQLPSIRDHLNERFVKPLAVNRMRALIPRAVEDARQGRPSSEAFDTLRNEINAYLQTSSGSGIDLPSWLRVLEQEIHKAVSRDVPETDPTEPIVRLPQVPVNLREMRRQLRIWTQRLTLQGKKR